MANSRKINLLLKSLESRNSSPSSENISRMIKSAVFTKKKNVKPEELVNGIEEKKNERYKEQQKDVNINTEIYRINKILERRIVKYKECFQQDNFIFKSIVEPKHLTVVDENFGSKIANEIERNLNKSSKTLIEMQPGLCLITKRLLGIKNLNNFILIEPVKKFKKNLENIREQGLSKVNGCKKSVEIVKDNPFKWYNHFQKYESYFNESPVSIFAILPWPLHGYLRYIYKLFCFHRGPFQYNHDPEFFFYVPEHFLARLKPEINPSFCHFNSALSVYSAILSRVSVLSQHSIEDFYPYPLHRSLNDTREEHFPQNLISFNNMYLIHIKLDNSLVDDENRAKFFHFIHQLWSQPNVSLRKALNCISCNESTIQDLENVFNKRLLQQQVCDLHALELYEVFNYLAKSSVHRFLHTVHYNKKVLEFFENDTNNELNENNKSHHHKLKTDKK